MPKMIELKNDVDPEVMKQKIAEVLLRDRKILTEVSGHDCLEPLLFPNTQLDHDAFEWLIDLLCGSACGTKRNKDRAGRLLCIISRLCTIAYTEHTAVHLTEKLESDNKAMRETIDHLTRKLTQDN